MRIFSANTIVRLTQKRRKLIWSAAAFGFFFSVFTFYPGFITTDSILQLHEARSFHFAGWHPVVMSLVWRYIDFIVAGSAGMLIFHNAMFWSGLAIIAELAIADAVAAPFVVLLVGFFPTVLALLSTVWKDVGLGTSLVFAFALILRADRRSEFKLLLLAQLPLFYGLAVRQNALLAVVPFYLWAGIIAVNILSPQKRLFAGYIVGIICFISGVTANNVITRHLVNPPPASPLIQIFSHDLMGVSVRVGEMLLPSSYFPKGEETLSVSDLSAVYEPRFSTASYFDLGGKPGRKLYLKAGEEAEHIPEIKSAWLSALRVHPAEYLSHRTSLFFHNVVGLRREVCIPFADMVQANDLGIPTYRSLWTHIVVHGFWVLRNILFRGGLSLLGLLFAFSFVAIKKERPQRIPIMVISLSGLLYLLPYFFISLDCDYRYVWWGTVAAVVATVLVWQPKLSIPNNENALPIP